MGRYGIVYGGECLVGIVVQWHCVGIVGTCNVAEVCLVGMVGSWSGMCPGIHLDRLAAMAWISGSNSVFGQPSAGGTKC